MQLLPKFYILKQLGDRFQSVDTSLCLGVIRRKLSTEERIYIIKKYYCIASADGVQKEWGRNFGTEPPTKTSIYRFKKQFSKQDSVCDTPRYGCPKNRGQGAELDAALAYIHTQ